LVVGVRGRNGVTWLMCPERLLTVRSTLRQAPSCPHPKSPVKGVWVLESVAIEMLRVFGMFRPCGECRRRRVADHGKFSELTHCEVLTMMIGVRASIDRHLP
jgi:hypothetical protein